MQGSSDLHAKGSEWANTGAERVRDLSFLAFVRFRVGFGIMRLRATGALPSHELGGGDVATSRLTIR